MISVYTRMALRRVLNRFCGRPVHWSCIWTVSLFHWYRMIKWGWKGFIWYLCALIIDKTPCWKLIMLHIIRNYKTVPKNKARDTDVINFVVTCWFVHGKWRADCTRQTTCSCYWHLSIGSAMASSLVSWHGRNVSNVCGQEVIACFVSGILANWLPARWFWRGPERMKSLL
jgi:hypothetical protein